MDRARGKGQLVTRRKFKPHPYQRIGMEWMLEHETCALWAGMGMGKTVTSMNFLDALHNIEGKDRPSLVLAPKRVTRSVWPRESAKWAHLTSLPVEPVIGAPAQREKALRADSPVKVINYEQIPWLVDRLRGRWPFDLVIADESTRLKNFRLKQGGVRAQALAQVRKHVKRWVNLSGTPAPNGLIDLWGQMWFLDGGRRLGKSFSAFEARWFAWQRKAAPGEQYKLQRIVLPFAEEQIHERLEDICLTLDPHDWFDFEEPIVRRVEVDLPPKAMRHYKEMERELFTLLESGEGVEALARGAAVMKCLQIASGAVWVDRGSGTWREIHKAKLEALESVVEEAAGMPVLVSYFFKPDLAMLKAHFPQGREFTDDSEVEDAWNRGEIPIMFIHPGGAAHGLDLQHGGNIVVFYSHWWDAEQHDQVIERIGPVRQLQSGYDRPVYIYYLTARKTVDNVVVARHATKAGVQDALMDYMNRTRRRG